MPSPAESFEGTIINREVTGEAYLRIFLFSRLKGLKIILFRMSKKSDYSSTPDLFDDVEFLVSIVNGGRGFPFVKDFQIVHRRSGIAKDYSRFHAASGVARLYLDNGPHLQDTIPFGQLLARSLSALDKGFDPPTILFKTLYQFGRLEGHPIKQDWLAKLENREQFEAIFRLNTKLSDLKPEKIMVTNLVNSLRSWLNTKTELKC